MSKTMKALLCLTSGIIVLMIGCSKSSEDQLSTPVTAQCDTTNMTYSNDVLPILKANCYSCHGNGNADGGISLGSYAAVKSFADNGNLSGVITHAAGYPPMPQDGSKLSDCDINTIQDWINRGATNN